MCEVWVLYKMPSQGEFKQSCSAYIKSSSVRQTSHTCWFNGLFVKELYTSSSDLV